VKKIQQLHVELIAVKAEKAEMYAFQKRYVESAGEEKAEHSLRESSENGNDDMENMKHESGKVS